MPTNENWYGSKWITPERRLAIYLRDEFTCAYCGVKMFQFKPGLIALDHLKPRSKGGGNESSNLVCVCSLCNSKRGNTPWRQYATGGAIERVRRLTRRKVNLALAKAIIAGTAADPRTEALR